MQQQVVVVTVLKTAEVPHVQFIDKVLTVPVDNLLYGGERGVFARVRTFFALRPSGR